MFDNMIQKLTLQRCTEVNICNLKFTQARVEYLKLQTR